VQYFVIIIGIIADQDEFSDTRALDEYRQQRIRQLQTEIARARFGDVVEIAKDEWVSQVTEGSKNGVCVCVHLYNNSFVECQLMDECLLNLAPRFAYVKFLKIRATSAVENWPEKNLPTLFVYKNGELMDQLITLRSVGGKTMKTEGRNSRRECLNAGSIEILLRQRRLGMVACEAGCDNDV
jgi:hypothetical protein